MKTIRFPAPSRFKSENDFLNRGVYRWLCRLAGTELYRHFRTGEVIPTADELADWLDAKAWPKVRSFVVDYQSNASKGQWTGTQYRRQLERAAAFCLENYDPVPIFIRASRGGQRSRRGKKYTIVDLMPLDGLSAREQAEKIGCSVRTVRRLRAELQVYDPVIAGVFDKPRERVSA